MIHPSTSTWPLRLALVLLLAVPLAGAPQSVRGEADDLSRALHGLQELIWRDPWRARERLNALRPRVAEAEAQQQALYYQRLAFALLNLYVGHEFESAVEDGLAVLTPDTPVQTRLFLELFDGIRARRAGDYARARQRMEQVVAAARARNLEFLAVFALAELGFTRSVAGDNELALTELQQAFAMAVARRDDFLIAFVNESFGAFYGYLNAYDESLAHYQKALDTYAELGYTVYEAEATYGFAISYRYAQRWEQALANFRRYRELTEGSSSDHGTFMAHYGLGMTYAEMDDCANALPNIDLALGTEGPLDFKAELYKRQAVCLARRGDAAGARGAIAAARHIFDQFTELEGTRWVLEVDKARAQVEAHLGDSARAFELMLAYHEDMLALERKNASERLMTLRLDLESARQDHEIELLKEQARVDTLELEQQRRDNRIQRLTTASWIGATCIVVGFLAYQLRNTRRFRDLSSRDELTGLYNRRFIFNHLEKLTRDLPVDRGELSIVLIDVDDFKGINDRYGHPAGDCILETMAELGQGQLRPGDEMARVGGEEFLCILPRTSVAQARAVAGRLLDSIRRHRFILPDGTPLHVTVSIGLAAFGPGCRDADSLYAAADDAMYRAKSAGKDRLNTAS